MLSGLSQAVFAFWISFQTICNLQFPDPHFKKKHKKRRVVQPQLIEAIDRRLAPDGLVFLQSDVMEVITS